MNVAAVGGISRLAVAVAALVGVGAVFVVARVLARRSRRPERTLVSLNGRE